MIQRRYQVIVGRNEPLILPLHDSETQFPAKVDTGAYRSSIHCAEIQVKEKDGQSFVCGDLLKGHPCAFGRSFYFESDEFEKVIVANSFGQKEERYEVKLRCKLGPIVFNTTFTLADRSSKLFPILIGRRALRKRFLVDVSGSNIDRKMLKDRYGKNITDDEEDFIGE